MVRAAAVACVQVRELVPEEVRAPVGVQVSESPLLNESAEAERAVLMYQDSSSIYVSSESNVAALALSEASLN